VKKENPIHVPAQLFSAVSYEKSASWQWIGFRLKQLLTRNSEVWNEVAREETGGFFTLFLKYHLPLLIPAMLFYFVKELFHFVNITLLARHLFINMPIAIAVYMLYLFMNALIAEELAEASQGRFAPQSGIHLSIFSGLILSFASVFAFLPIVGLPCVLMALIEHYRQLIWGAKSILNIGAKQKKIFMLAHLLVWTLLGLSTFFFLSLVNYLFSGRMQL